MEEWENHNKAIDDKGYAEKINDNNKEMGKLRGKEFYKISFWIIVSLVFLYAGMKYYGITHSESWLAGNTTMDVWDRRYGGFFLGIGMFIIAVIATAILYSFLSPTINRILVRINQNYCDKLANEITGYKKELANKHYIQLEKQKMDTSYNQQISTLNNQLKTYKQKKIDNLTSKFNLIVNRYSPSKIGQLSKSNDEIKECIENKIIGEVIWKKFPVDLC